MAMENSQFHTVYECFTVLLIVYFMRCVRSAKANMNVFHLEKEKKQYENFIRLHLNRVIECILRTLN